MYYPGIKPEESNVHIKQPGNEYAEAFQRLMNRETQDRFMADYIFDIRPVFDERPFFQYYLKVKNIKEIYRVMGENGSTSSKRAISCQSSFSRCSS